MKKNVSHGEAEFKLAWGMKLGGKSFDDIRACMNLRTRDQAKLFCEKGKRIFDRMRVERERSGMLAS
jgi:hypothetical protein